MLIFIAKGNIMKKMILYLLIIFFYSFSIEAQNKYAVEIDGAALIPTGTFTELYNPSFGIDGSFIFSAHTALQISINTGYHNFTFDNDAFNKSLVEQNSNFTANLDAPVNLIPLSLGLKYIVGDSRKWKPYFSLDAGIYFYTLKISGTITSSSGIETPLETKEDDNDTVIKIGTGILNRLAYDMFLNLSVKYNILSDNKSIHYNSNGSVDTNAKTLNFVSILAGLQYYF